MTSLFYKIIAGFGECRRIVGSESDRVRIHVEGAEGGCISVEGISAPLKGGIARIDLSSLPDGEYAPTLHGPGGAVRLESIRKEGGAIRRVCCDSELVSRLCLRVESLEARLAELEKSSAEHEAAIKGKPLFDCFG